MGKTIVNNAWQLEQLLEKKYGERFEADFLSSLTGGVSGSFDSKRILITFKSDEFLLISTSADGKDVLEQLLPTLTEVMGGISPICSYDLQNVGTEEKDVKPTIEWDIVDPEDRIKKIVNGRAFSDGSKTLNLKLYNGKDVSDYLESKQEKEDRTKNTRIYGIDPGCISNVEKINNLSEVDLYFAIDVLGEHIWRSNHDMAYGRIPEFDLTEEQYALEYLVYQTTKFGVELPDPEIDKHITATPSYNAWYKFYADHFKYTLTDEQWDAFQLAQIEGKDTSMFMPSGHWTDLLEKPVQKG